MRRTRVSIYKRSTRPHYEAHWSDPVTGKTRTRTTGTNRRREAERFAVRLEEKINAGESVDVANPEWSAFRELFETEYLSAKSDAHYAKMSTTLNLIEDVINPGRVGAIDATQIGRLIGHLRKAGRSEFTVRGHAVHLATILKWAVRREFIPRVPHIDIPGKVGTVRGRPITQKEFDKMLKATPSVTGVAQSESWQFLLKGLYWSGLRLSEALRLTWRQGLFVVDMDAKPRPLFRIQGAGQKNRKHQVSPVAPEFAKMLEEIPRRKRRGFVFDPQPQRGKRRPVMPHVSRVISDIGRKAGIVVDATGKAASAHDLRRTFGDRWANRVLPNVLQNLMRHEAIATTLEFYVSRDAGAMAETVWDGFTDTSTDNPPPPKIHDPEGESQTRDTA